jgi:hypothetical protein
MNLHKDEVPKYYHATDKKYHQWTTKATKWLPCIQGDNLVAIRNIQLCTSNELSLRRLCIRKMDRRVLHKINVMSQYNRLSEITYKLKKSTYMDGKGCVEFQLL